MLVATKYFEVKHNTQNRQCNVTTAELQLSGETAATRLEGNFSAE